MTQARDCLPPLALKTKPWIKGEVLRWVELTPHRRDMFGPALKGQRLSVISPQQWNAAVQMVLGGEAVHGSEVWFTAPADSAAFRLPRALHLSNILRRVSAQGRFMWVGTNLTSLRLKYRVTPPQDAPGMWVVEIGSVSGTNGCRLAENILSAGWDLYHDRGVWNHERNGRSGPEFLESVRRIRDLDREVDLLPEQGLQRFK